jgi:hypothetical protein
MLIFTPTGRGKMTTGRGKMTIGRFGMYQKQATVKVIQASKIELARLSKKNIKNGRGAVGFDNRHLMPINTAQESKMAKNAKIAY